MELIPVDGNGTLQVMEAAYLLALSLTVSDDKEKKEEAIKICDNALRRDSMYTRIFIVRYIYIYIYIHIQ